MLYTIADKEGFLNVNGCRTANTKIIEYINDRPFEISSTEDSEGVNAIRFHEFEPFTSLYNANIMGTSPWTNWFNDDEMQFIKPFTEDIPKYNVMSIKGKTDRTIIIHLENASLEKAEEFAESLLSKDVNKNLEVIIYQAVSKFRIEAVPQIVKKSLV